MKPAKILLLDLTLTDDLSLTLLTIFESPYAGSTIDLKRHRITERENVDCETELPAIISCFQPDIILLASPTGLMKQARLLFESMKREAVATPVIVIVEASEANEVLEWLKLGVADFITLPLSVTNVLPRVWKLLERVTPKEALTRTLKERLGMRLLVGESPAFIKEIKKIPLMAKCNASVLILGETGTGKELCARAIHYLGARSHKPFIPVNCGAIPTELVENELFGHERGAFTGAKNSQAGLIQEADGGTLFLDEIDCLPLLAQVKLLRFLQEKEYRPLGSTKTSMADVRIVAATNSDPEQAVRTGRLRQDFYYRLNVIPLVLPPLRTRREDILLLAQHFLARFAAEEDKQITDFSTAAAQMLVSYDWPGNIRELEHIIRRAVVLSTGTHISDANLGLPCSSQLPLQESLQGAKRKMVAEFEKNYIKDVLLMYNGNISKAAQAARKNRRAFWQLIRKYEIDAKHFKSGNS